MAFARLQAVLHAAQWVRLLSRVSQPLASLPSQLPQPPLQEAIRQDPEEHVAVAFVREQLVPQERQLVRVLRRVSQPFPGPPLQSPQPPLQLAISQL